MSKISAKFLSLVREVANEKNWQVKLLEILFISLRDNAKTYKYSDEIRNEVYAAVKNMSNRIPAGQSVHFVSFCEDLLLKFKPSKGKKYTAKEEKKKPVPNAASAANSIELSDSEVAISKLQAVNSNLHTDFTFISTIFLYYSDKGYLKDGISDSQESAFYKILNIVLGFEGEAEFFILFSQVFDKLAELARII